MKSDAVKNATGSEIIESDNQFYRNIASSLAGRKRRIIKRSARASVLIPIVNNDGYSLLLTRRTQSLPTHKGQVAFPGGGVEPDDTGPVATALREAAEEISLNPKDAEILGLLDDFPTVDDKLSVTPVVAGINNTSGLSPNPDEVARIFCIPLINLSKEENWTSRMITKYKRPWPIYFFKYDGETLWGLSAYLVIHFMEICNLNPPFKLPDAELK